MMPPFDIFQMNPDGSVLWRGTAETMEDAQAHIRELAASSPGEFVIHSHQTGNRLVVKCDGKG